MRNCTMESKARIKKEPMSPNLKSPMSTGAISKMPPVSIKTEMGGRLASFKPPRDLTLSASSNNLALKINQPLLNKKVFVPNLNVTRRKGPSIQNASDTKSNVPIKPNFDKGRRPRNKGNFVQTQGVFSEGLAPGKPREYSRSSGTSNAQPILEKPKLNLNRNINKKKEDSCMKNLLKDDFIDDPSILPDVADCPKSLPLLLNSKINISRNIDSTFENLQVKTEKIEYLKPDEVMSTSSDLFQIFDNPPEPRLLVFDFPEDIVKTEEGKLSKQEKMEKAASSEAPIKSEITHRLSNVGEGYWGSLRILEDGTAYILVGQERIPVNLTRHTPKQNIMSVHLDTATGRGEIINLGKVTASLKCSSDVTFVTK